MPLFLYGTPFKYKNLPFKNFGSAIKEVKFEFATDDAQKIKYQEPFPVIIGTAWIIDQQYPYLDEHFVESISFEELSTRVNKGAPLHLTYDQIRVQKGTRKPYWYEYTEGLTTHKQSKQREELSEKLNISWWLFLDPQNLSKYWNFFNATQEKNNLSSVKEYDRSVLDRIR